ncbi:DUF1573 domain-containing protein [Clostridium sp. MSJ-4]|uniref:DUF1573 domain-containing protein n=1 Tax=Clostridium simiarum TaxID=2841506 RepID=A0ABS6F012_9CLOT|nr:MULTISPECIES: hypothetical protein [Clostridium]MBU5591715.1 DUF1573 domain-containing protein [Clostridium simiarum]
MKDIIFDDFQNCVNEYLIRHKSVLDILTKLQESEARVNRAVAKSVTNCGCIKVNAEKQCMPCDEDSISDLNNCLKNHLNGKLCENCREVIERELGNNIFYLSSLCNLLDLNLYDIFLKEYDRMQTLGKYDLR